MDKTPWEKVQLARNPQRPSALNYIENIFEEFIEFHGDRAFGDDSAIIGGVGRFKDTPVTIIAQQKGRNTKEKIYRNFAMPHPEGYRKALRLMKQAEKFHRPIICFVDTPGAFCGIGAEERGQGQAIAENLATMMVLKVPILTFVISEGGSGGALALSVADRVYMLENAIYSILSPEGFASILYKDASRAQEAAEDMKLTAKDLYGFNIIDGIIKEADLGVQNDPQYTINQICKIIESDLLELAYETPLELTEKRYNKYRSI